MKTFKSILLQAIAVIIVFNLVSMFRETSLLSYNQTAPQFNLVTLDGETVNSTQLTKKPTLIYFWAPWCSICNISLPNLQEFYTKYGDNINVLSVALSYEEVADVHMMVVKHKLDFPVLMGNSHTSKDFSITGFPTYYLLDEERKVVAKSLGYSSELGMKLRALTL